MMGIVGGEGFQLLSVSVTDKQGDRTMGTMVALSVPIVLLSNRQQVPRMINAECQLFQRRAILEIGSTRKRERVAEETAGVA